MKKFIISTQIEIMKKLLFILIICFLHSCKKDSIDNTQYLVFYSDSTNVYGTRLYNSDTAKLYPNIPYVVTKNQSILFNRLYQANTNHFTIDIFVGPDKYYNSVNSIHYSLKNEYLFTVK